MMAKVGDDNHVTCGKCGLGLGHISPRRWWPPWEAQNVKDAPNPFYRRIEVGSEWAATLAAQPGYVYQAERAGVGRGPLGVRVECPKCKARQVINGEIDRP
jgi:hypothetical protein